MDDQRIAWEDSLTQERSSAKRHFFTQSRQRDGPPSVGLMGASLSDPRMAGLSYDDISNSTTRRSRGPPALTWVGAAAVLSMNVQQSCCAESDWECMPGHFLE